MKQIFLKILCLLPLFGYAQVKIGFDKEIHPHALLDVESVGKGILLPNVKEDIELPGYDESSPTSYIKNLKNQGLILYHQGRKDVLKFDGYRWISASQKSILNYKNVSLFTSDRPNEVVANVLAITSRPVLIFNKTNDIENNSINHLNLKYTNNGEIEFIEDGYYKINPSIRIKGAGGLSVGNASTIISLQAIFGQAINNGWQKIHENSFRLDGLVITAGDTNSTNSFSIVKYFKKGDKIRIKAGIQASDGLSLGTGVTYVLNDKNTFLFIEKIN